MTLFEEGFVDCYSGLIPKMATGSYSIGFEYAREEIESPELFQCGFVTFKHYLDNPGMLEIHLDDRSNNRMESAKEALNLYLLTQTEILHVNQETADKFATSILAHFTALGLEVIKPH